MFAMPISFWQWNIPARTVGRGSAYPHAADQVFMLSRYGKVRELGDIDDPAGQLGGAYYRMKREVQQALTGAFRRMRAEGILAKAMVAHLQARADEPDENEEGGSPDPGVPSCRWRRSMPIPSSSWAGKVPTSGKLRRLSNVMAAMFLRP
ncbi:MAG: hypothetical protein MZW92_15070 [Comamonadaceae bacterium]|nr:hypothetical protein [Comamonadaceae bacterium]